MTARHLHVAKGVCDIDSSSAIHSAVIPTVVAKSHTIRKCAVTVEEIDLHQVWQPYLVVKGFPPFVTVQLLKQHFEKVASGAEIQSVEIKGGEASIVYVNPKSKYVLMF